MDPRSPERGFFLSAPITSPQQKAPDQPGLFKLFQVRKTQKMITASPPDKTADPSHTY